MRIFLLTLFILTIMSVEAQKPKTVLNHLAVYVKDLKKSEQFYSNILLLDTIPNPFNDGRHLWYSIGHGLSLHVIEGPKDDVSQYRSTHTCFSVADIDSFINHLTKAGIEHEDSKGNKRAITIRADGVKQIYIKDPEGYWIEINNEA